MKIGNIPFLIVFLSSLFPLLGALLNVPAYHLPAGSVAVAVILILITQKKIAVRKNILTMLVAPMSFIIFIMQLIIGHGFVILSTGGYVLIFMLVFFTFFSMGTGSSLISMVRGISYLYKFFLITMLIEAVLIMLDLQPRLVAIFPGYKNYNSADILRYFGLMQDAGGLNSVLLGSQIAGMLALFSAIWFWGIRTFKDQGLAVGHSGFWIVLSLLVYLITVNGTNFLLLLLAGGIYVFLVNKKHRVKLLCGFMALIIGVYLAIDKHIILNRVFNKDLVHLQPSDLEIYERYGILDQVQDLTTFEYYIYEFYSPVKRWLVEDWVNELFGVGAQFFLDDLYYVAGDFGIGIGMLSAGALWIAMFSCAVIYSCISALTKVEAGSNERQLWSKLGAINAMITLLWLASTVHYNQAFANPGGMTLFALHFAVTVYSRYRYWQYKLRDNQARIFERSPERHCPTVVTL